MDELQFNLLGIPILALLGGVGVFLLVLCYLKRNPYLPIFWKHRDINQHKGRAKRRRKGGTLKGWRTCQNEVKKARKMISLLQSHLCRHHDTIRFRQLLCPDPFFEVCNCTTSGVNQMLFLEALEDATPSVIPLAATAPVTDSSFSLSPAFTAGPPGDLKPSPLPGPSLPLPSLFLPNFLLPSPPGHSLPPESFLPLNSKLPVDHSTPQPLACPPLLLHDIQKGDPIAQPKATLPPNTIFSLDHTVFQDANLLPSPSETKNPTESFACHRAPPTLSVSPPPDCTLTATQSQSISISLKPVPESSSPDRPGGGFTCIPTTRGSGPSSLTMSGFSCWQAHAQNMFLPTLSHSSFQQVQDYCHLPETHLWEVSANKHKEASGISFLDFNIQAVWERRMKKRMPFQILEKEEKEEGPFSKQMWSEHQWTLVNSLHPLDVQVTTAPKTGWKAEDKPEHLRICQQLHYLMCLEENLRQKYSQLFWGLPSLHSESLVATLLVSSSTSPQESHFVLFNGLCNASAVKMQDQEVLVHPHSHFFPLPGIYPQPLPQTLSQSQPLPFTQVNPQAHLQSHFPIIPSSSSSQNRDCGEFFHRSKNGSDSPILAENQYLAWHVLKKHQESLWGLVPAFPKSQKAICPQVPNLPLVSQASHVCVPVSIFPGHYHITCEPQEKLEFHVPRKVIPHWCLHTCRHLQSLVLMEPQCKLTQMSQPEGRHVCSKFSGLQGHSSKDLAKTELSFPGSFHERVPTELRLGMNMRRNLGYILEKSPEDSPQRVSECYLRKGLRAALEAKSNCVCHSRNHSENELLNVSRKDTEQNQMKTTLSLHLRKKFWQITVGRIPIGVCCSWLAADSALALCGNSQTKMENTNSKKTMVDSLYCQISILEPSFLDANTRQVLEAHIIRFQMSQRWGLPLRVLESIKFYLLREAKTWPLPQVDFPSSAMHMYIVDSKAEFSNTLERSSKTFHGNRMKTTNSVPTLDHSLPAMSSVGNEGQRTLKPSHSDTNHELAEGIQTAGHGSQIFQHLTHSIIAQGRQSGAVLENRCSPEESPRQAEAGHKPKDENVSSRDGTEMVQGRVMVQKNLEHFAMCNSSRDVFNTEQVCTLQSQSCDVLTTSELESSKMINVNLSKVEAVLTTEYPSPKILVPQDPKLSDPERQPFSELKLKWERQEHSQAQECATDMPLTSDCLTSKASLTQSQSVCCGDMGASQMLHVHLEDNKISTEQQQESWHSKQVLGRCQPKNFPQRKSAKKMRSQGLSARKCRSEESGIGISLVRKKSHCVEDRKLEKASSSLSQNEQFPPESYLRKKMRQFIQWIKSKKKITKQESFWHQDPVESVTALVSGGPPEAHELMIAIGKILEEKVTCRYESEASRFSQQKEELQAQVGPEKRHPSNSQASFHTPHDKGASIEFCSQEAVSTEQNCLTSVRENREKASIPQKVGAFKKQLLSQSQPTSPLPSRKPVRPPRPTCVHQVRQALPATLTTDKSTVFRDLTLLFKQKTLLQHFEGEEISLKKSFSPC